MNHMDKADTFEVDATVANADAARLRRLVLPGGVANPDFLRTDEDAVRFARSFFEAGKPVGAICHGPWTLVEADVVRGRTLTSWPSLRTDIRNAGGDLGGRGGPRGQRLRHRAASPTTCPAFCAEARRGDLRGPPRRAGPADRGLRQLIAPRSPRSPDASGAPFAAPRCRCEVRLARGPSDRPGRLPDLSALLPGLGRRRRGRPARACATRLDHLADLGVDALWLSPIYPSPMADFGYDVSDYTGVDPVFGSLADVDALVAEAHARGLAVLLDIVPCHTSIEHPWFREHPDWYIWRDEPNNWSSAFGGSAWSKLGERYYLHSFYPEQPDLDWRNPEVVAAMQDVFRFWLERGVDGFRIDAIDRLLKDPQLRDDPPAERAVRAAAARGRGEARAHELAQRPRHGGGARRDPRGGGRRPPRGRGLPAGRALGALPRALRRRVRVRAPPGPVGGRAAAGRDRGEHAHARRGVGDVQPRLRASRHALRRARTRARPRCSC